MRTVICKQCGSECKYDDHSVWEGNREFEEVICPCCGAVLDRVFTDKIPIAKVVKSGMSEEKTD